MKIKVVFLAIVVVLVGVIIYLGLGVEKNFDKSLGTSPSATPQPTYPPVDYTFQLSLQQSVSQLIPKFNITVTIPDKTTHLVNHEKTTMTFTGNGFSLKLASVLSGKLANYEEARKTEKLEQAKPGVTIYRISDVSGSYVYTDNYKTGTDCGNFADCSFNTITVQSTDKPGSSGTVSAYCYPSDESSLKACDEIMNSFKASLI